jgi:non-ribosomal peptide synthetase component F
MYPKECLVPSVFHARCARAPDHVAVANQHPTTLAEHDSTQHPLDGLQGDVKAESGAESSGEFVKEAAR